MNRIALLTAGLVLGLASAAAAQTAPACAGSWQVIRVSTIKPGKMAVFMSAMKEQQAWYAAKRLPDRILVARMLEGGGAFSSTKVITVHDKAAGLDAPAHTNDARWDAFVAKFRDSSDIIEGGPVCVSDVSK